MAKIKKFKKKKGTTLTTYENVLNYFSVLKDVDIIEMEYRLQSGELQGDVLKWLQSKGYFVYAKLITMRTHFGRYNRYILKPKMLASVDTVDIYKELMVLKEKIDSLKEFSVIVVQQKQRLNRMIQMERTIELDNEGQLTKVGREMAYQVRKEIELMGSLLEKLANLQMKTGVLKVAPKFISGEILKDENDASKIVFRLREDFMEHMEDIEAELLDVVDLEEIKQNGKK